jgi:hypothetical protein
MHHFIAAYLPWILSAITLWMMKLAGDKHPSAWTVGLCNQALWLTWIVSTESWGFLVLTLALCVMYARNMMKWRAA